MSESASERMSCPRCGCKHFEVVSTRHRRNSIVRRRECRHCGRRVTTVEKIAPDEEKNGRQ